MLNKLRDILNTYTDEELEEMDLWVNSSWQVDKIIIDDHSIDLVTDDLIIDFKEDPPISFFEEEEEENESNRFVERSSKRETN